MIRSRLLSLPLLALILPACGDTQKEKELKRTNSQLIDSYNEISRREGIVQKELSVAKAEVERQTQTKTVLEASLSKASEELSRTQKKLEALVIRQESELRKKEKQIADLNSEKIALDKQLKDAQRQLELLNREKAELTARLSEATLNTESLNAEISKKDEAIKAKEAEIARLMANLSGDTSDLLAQLTKLQGEKDDLQKRYEGTLKELDELYLASLKPVRGLWVNPDKITSISTSNCYEMVYVDPNGKGFVQGISCENGQIQYQSYALQKFAGKRLEEPSRGDAAPIGFALVGKLRESSCQAETSLLASGDTLAFEMTKEANGGRGTLLASYRMTSQVNGVYKGFESGTQIFNTTTAVSREAMEAFTANDGTALGLLGKAALTLMQAHEGLATQKGCFTATGEFQN